MRQIEDYEQFCNAFESEDDEIRKEAKLLLFIQNWIIRILDRMEEDTLDYSLKKMVEQNADKMSNKDTLKDALSCIVDDSYSAFRHLNDSMREKIIRENVRMPVYKVREINSYGLNWLSRQSGRTIRQKVSSAGNSIMAVQRRMSPDTAENRLYVAFAKEIYEKLNTKTESLGKNDVRLIPSEEDMRDELAAFLRRDDIAEVRRWENLPPNNTLLSDQNYKKIWHAWNEIKKIDERIKNDSDLMGNRLATIFFVELLVYFREKLRIPQEPVEIDYDEYNVHLFDEKLYCLDENGNTVTISKKDNCINLESLKRNVEVVLLGNRVKISVSGEEDKEYEVTQDKIYTYVRYIAARLGVGIPKVNTVASKKELTKFKNVVVDLFSLHPGYIGDDSSYEKLTERVLQQKYIGKDIDGDERSYYIPCDETNAIKMISGVTDTYTIPFAVDKGSTEQMKRLMHMMENYIITDSFTYVFPDAYNDLQLSMVHKASKMVYRNVRNVPLSIGTAFRFQTTESFKNNFKPGDFLLVVNLLDDEVTFTLVAGKYDENLNEEISDYKGIVWERHPTSTTLFKNETDSKIVDKLTKAGCVKPEKLYKLLGLDGLCDEVGNLSVFFGNEWFQITSAVKDFVEEFKINITDSVTEFLTRNRSVVHGANIHIVSLVDNLIYKGSMPFYSIGKKGALEGCKELERLEQLTDIPLWHDHLPALAIKLMYGKFDLIRNARVEPKFEEKQSIPIAGTFTLPKKCKEYHFNLVQDENARKMQYEAVIKNPAFPLNRDVECDLKMTYQYGAEEPYELIFVPKNPKTAGFSEAKVKWYRLEKYATDALKAPAFPSKISWDELRRYPGENDGYINVLDVLEEEFKLINEGYYTFDISDTLKKQDKNGKWCGNFMLKKEREEVKVQWFQSDWDGYSKLPQNISEISFWITPVANKIVPDVHENKRYRIPDLWDARVGDDLWFKNRYGCYQCIVYFDYDGETETISVIDRKFDMPERAHEEIENINDISFFVRELSDGKLQAVNIHDEDGPALKIYQARNICESGKEPTPPKFFINTYYNKWIRTLFANNRSLSERECPKNFKICFEKSVDSWVNLYYEYRDPKDKKVLFKLLSLAAKDIGKDYYDIAYELLKMYTREESYVPYEIGCAFCDLSNEMEKELMESTLNTVTKDYEAIGILAKALWHNEQFVYNVDPDLLLNDYFPKAVDYIGGALNRLRKEIALKGDLENVKYLGNVKYCLEFILGIMRLRNLNDPVINGYLSLNNPKMQKLYKYLEMMADDNLNFRSFLKLEITSKGIYEKMCDLLYALFVYVTGNDTEGEIRISLNTDD